jgi:exopolyphosphatase/guanosine-5'-triphosphate,3'-diphosphate pyrophosphatase
MPAKPDPSPVLRWEWRTFAPDLNALRKRLPDLSAGQPRRSRESCIVCALVPHDAKIRFDMLDVKRLLQVDAQGLELWDPVLKDTFPVSAGTVARLFGIWKLGLPGFARASYSLTLFLEEIVAPNRQLHRVDVEKTRYGFVYEGCIAEIADVTLNGVPMATFCLENESEAAVLSAMADLGYAGARNVSYTQAIKEALGLTALPSPA